MSWFKGLAVVVCVPTLLVGAVVVGAALKYRSDVLTELGPSIDHAETYRPPGSVRIFDRNGDEIDAFWKEKRVWVPLSDTPEHVWGAVVAAEDRRFFEHGGVDYRGIARAARTNLTGGSVRQGASTLTQQLVKNLVVGKERTFSRKAREAIAAWELERRLSKEQILELYLNYVYLGSGNHGIESAARDYFHTSAAELTPAQAAMLAALIPAPSRYDPRVNEEAAKTRRDRVLHAMVETGALANEALDAALAEPVTIEAGGVDGHRTGAAYATQVRRDLVDWLGPEAPFELAMQVHTPMDPEVQSVAETAIGEASRAVMRRQGLWAIAEHLRKDADREAFLEVTAASPQVGECFHALLTDNERMVLKTRNHTWTLDKADRKTKVRHRLRMEGRGLPFWGTARVGDKVRVCATSEDTVALDRSEWVQGAAVVIEHATGDVVAMVGGNEPVLEGFVRATQALRQPGSTFKPFVYAAAIENGHSQTEVMMDEEVTLVAGDGSEWTPGNGGKEEYRGEVPLRTAMAASLNSISVQLVDDVGSDEVARVARRMGVRTPLQEVLSLGLGSSEVTVMDQAVGFATIAGGGVYREPVWVRRVEDREGRVLGTAGGLVRADERVLGELPGRAQQAISPGVAFEVADMMTDVVDRGTGRKAKKKGFWRAGKTGTTNQVTDTWFAGFTPRYTVAVWVGTDDNGSLGSGESGAKTALPAWKKIVDALPAEPTDDLPIPEEAMRIRWNGLWVGVNRQTVPRMIWPVQRIGDRPIPEFPTKL